MKASILAMFFLVNSWPSFASEIYQCEFVQRVWNKGWLPQVVVAQLSRDRTTFTVSDPITVNFHKTPTKTRNFENNEGILDLHWAVEGTLPEDPGSRFRMKYSLYLVKSRMRARIHGQPVLLKDGHEDHVYSSEYNANGTCKKIKG